MENIDQYDKLPIVMVKRAYQPKKLPRIRKYGYRARKKTKSGRAILKRRRKKGRKNLSATDKMAKRGAKPKKTKR